MHDLSFFYPECLHEYSKTAFSASTKENDHRFKDGHNFIQIVQYLHVENWSVVMLTSPTRRTVPRVHEIHNTHITDAVLVLEQIVRIYNILGMVVSGYTLQ